MKFDQDLRLNLRYDFGKMNSTLGSVVPLAMFFPYLYSLLGLTQFRDKQDKQDTILFLGVTSFSKYESMKIVALYQGQKVSDWTGSEH